MLKLDKEEIMEDKRETKKTLGEEIKWCREKINDCHLITN